MRWTCQWGPGLDAREWWPMWHPSEQRARHLKGMIELTPDRFGLTIAGA